MIDSECCRQWRPTAGSRGSWRFSQSELAFSGTHAAVLSSGKVLYWAYDPNEENTIQRMQWQLYDIETDTLSNLEIYDRNLFCSGHTFLSDGTLLVVGGQSNNWVVAQRGADHDVHVFDATAESWIRLTDMPAARYYPTVVMLSSGDALIIGGAAARGRPNTLNHEAEAFIAELHQRTPRFEFNRQLVRSLYPFALTLPAKKGSAVFVFSNAECGLFYPAISNAGPGVWHHRLFPTNSHFTRNYPHQGCAVLLPYAEGDAHLRVLVVGGEGETEHHGHRLATATAEIFEYIIDAVDGSSWRPPLGGHPSNRRFMGDGVLLADGSVLLVNGAAVGEADHSDRPVRVPELFDPATESWLPMAAATRNRMYHSTAVLLPDGRVLVAGNTEHWNPHNQVEDTTLEIFTPPYLHHGPRPELLGGSSWLRHGADPAVFEFRSEDGISAVHLIRMSSVTHTLNTDQRCIRLRFDVAGHKLVVTCPKSTDWVPPGYYYLFAISKKGVPSVAKIVRVSHEPSLKLIYDKIFDVPENVAEVDTGVEIQANEYYEILGAGRIWAGVALTGKNGPEGWSWVDHDPKFPLHTGPDARPYALIAKLGSGAYFYVGAVKKRSRHTGATARLYLRTNDDTPGNGSGAFRARVRVWRDP